MDSAVLKNAAPFVCVQCYNPFVTVAFDMNDNHVCSYSSCCNQMADVAEMAMRNGTHVRHCSASCAPHGTVLQLYNPREIVLS
eukprot:344888-Amphidinium_carterae.1